jgi:hypothetical protein
MFKKIFTHCYFLLLHMAAKCPQRQRYGEGQQQGVILYN